MVYSASWLEDHFLLTRRGAQNFLPLVTSTLNARARGTAQGRHMTTRANDILKHSRLSMSTNT